MVLTTLKWDMSAVVSLDFLDHLIARLHLMLEKPSSDGSKETVEEIRRFATDLCLMSSKGKFKSSNSNSNCNSLTLTSFTLYIGLFVYPLQL